VYEEVGELICSYRVKAEGRLHEQTVRL
jgi:hypothetical protein